MGRHGNNKAATSASHTKSKQRLNKVNVETDDEDDLMAELQTLRQTATDASFSGQVGIGIALSFLSFALFLVAEFAPLEELRWAFLTLATVIAALAVFTTYSVGGRGRYSNTDWTFFQPLKGGIRFVALQIVGWMFFGLSILVPGLFMTFATLHPGTAVKGVAICAGAGAIISEITVVTSLLLYRPKQSTGVKGTIDELLTHHGLQSFLISETGRGWWTSFIGLQALLALVGMGLSVVADVVQHESWSWVFIMSFTVASFAIPSFLTYGVGGPWKHHVSTWRFFQPGIGGVKFVILQAMSWGFFSIAMCIFIAHFLMYFGYFNQLPLPTMVSGGISGLLAQLLLTSSLFVYKHQDKSEAVLPQQSSAFYRLIRFLVVSSLYNVQVLTGFSLCMSFALSATYPNLIVLGWILGFIFYAPTYLWAPAVSGRRVWRTSSYRPVANMIASYFDLKVYNAGKTTLSLDNGEKYIFGYHPHGLLPISCAWATSSAIWDAVFPNFRLAYLTAR
jgi:hypothetical protein